MRGGVKLRPNGTLKLEQFDGSDLESVTLQVAGNIYAQVVFFVGGFERFFGFLAAGVVKFYEFLVGGEDSIAAHGALKGARTRMRIWIGSSFLGTVGVNERDVFVRLVGCQSRQGREAE